MVITCLHFPNVLNPKQLSSLACQSGGLSKRPKLGFNLPASTSSAATIVTVTDPTVMTPRRSHFVKNAWLSKGSLVECAFKKKLPAKTRKAWERNTSKGISVWQASSTLTSCSKLLPLTTTTIVTRKMMLRVQLQQENYCTWWRTWVHSHKR